MSAPSPPVASIRLSSSNISARETWGAPSSSVSLSTGIFDASENQKSPLTCLRWLEQEALENFRRTVAIIQNCASAFIKASRNAFLLSSAASDQSVTTLLFMATIVLKYSGVIKTRKPLAYMNTELSFTSIGTYICSERWKSMSVNILQLTSEDINILPQSLILLQVLQEVLVLSKEITIYRTINLT